MPVTVGPTTGFRHRARLAIRGRLEAPKLGLFLPGTHRVVTVPNCRVHHPLVNEVAAVVRGALVDAHVPPYSERAHAGLARYLQVVVERASRTAQVTLVANAAGVEPLAPCLALIRERLGSRLHSLWLNANVVRTNTILGTDFHRWCGPEAVVERFGGAAIHYPPGAFGQNNLDVAAQIVEHVRASVPRGATVAEFYGGVGAIGLSLLADLGGLRVNEVGPASLRGLELGIAALPPELAARVDVAPGPAGAAVAIAAGADVVVADPPRKGLDAALLAHLRDAPPRRFVYVSCGLESFLADAARLLDDGRLALTGLHVFDLMPYTEHLETVALFDRR